MRTLVTRKKATLHAAKSKVQKLKEQLEVAERIVAASEKQIETHNQQVVYLSQELIVFELTYYTVKLHLVFKFWLQNEQIFCV